MAQSLVRNRTDAPNRTTGAPTSWDPLAQVEYLTDQLARFLSAPGGISSLTGDTFTPLADVEETDDSYIVRLDLPGVKKSEVDIHIFEGRRLMVSGERKEKERIGRLRRRTRAVGSFLYEITFPEEVDEEGVQATLDNGELTITVPKAPAARTRRIEVK